MRKVVSGGQAGVDIISLNLAKSEGFETGGWMAKWFETLDGPHPDWARMFGLEECEEEGYPARTVRNVRDSDATVVIAQNLGRCSGSLLTINECRRTKKPCLFIAWPIQDENWQGKRQLVATFCQQYDTVNFAGSREIDHPERLESFLEEVLLFLKEGEHVGAESNEAQ